ncbi:hypothetical protein BDB13_0565 [Rhodococcus sp. OK302]|nr:hypothetical protein BDB13_0565 [Rhodococcus sp. OK302]
MELVMLGTGAADGWPNPFCTCESCSGALENGSVRGHTAALLDNRILWTADPKFPVPLRDTAEPSPVSHTFC